MVFISETTKHKNFWAPLGGGLNSELIVKLEVSVYICSFSDVANKDYWSLPEFDRFSSNLKNFQNFQVDSPKCLRNT